MLKTPKRKLRSSRRAGYEAGLLAQVATGIAEEFGKGFDASNLHYMKQFYLTFPICDALCRELSWTHYRLLLRVDDPISRRDDFAHTECKIVLGAPARASPPNRNHKG